jgi:RNA polymerase sigma factor (TIGR02999 family)
MNPDAPGTITSILQQARGGSREAVDQVFPVLYEELRRLAHLQLRGQPPDSTLNTTALIHEAYLRLVDQTSADWSDRAHFFAYSARAMRSVLVDYARQRSTGKRGGNAVHLSLDDNDLPIEQQADLLIGLDEALTRLGALSERLCQTVECRFFGGMTEEETAAVLGVSDRTVRRDWLKAKAWLYADLSGEPAR